MRTFIKLLLYILLFISHSTFSQNKWIGLGGYWGSGLSININYAIEWDNSFFIRPNIGALTTKDGKELYSFFSYEIDFGYAFFKGHDNKIYLALAGSYISFISQEHEGNASFISDIQPPYYFTGKTRENCFGLSSKIGSVINVNTWFFVGLELKYSILFPKIKYNYLPKEFSLIKDNESISIILIGIQFGFIL
jgi:hypothetical protein